MVPAPQLTNAAYATGARGSVLDRLTVSYVGATFDGYRELQDPPGAATRASRAPWVFREERHRIIVRFLAGTQDSSHQVAARLIEALQLGGAGTAPRAKPAQFGLGEAGSR